MDLFNDKIPDWNLKKKNEINRKKIITETEYL